MWILIPPIVHSDPDLTDTAKYMFGLILFESGLQGSCQLTDGEFAEQLGVTETTIGTHMKVLEEKGLIDVEWPQGGPRYVFPKFRPSNKAGTNLAFSTSTCTRSNEPSVDVHVQQQLQKSMFMNKHTQKDLNETPVVENPPSPIREIFDYWSDRRKEALKACGVDTRKQKLTDTRRRRIASRLSDGRSVEEIKSAIDGCMASEYHVANRYLDIELICRSDEKLERFILLDEKYEREQSLGPKLRVLN